MAQLKTTVVCPYCGHENNFTAENPQGYTQREIYNCFVDEGGCDGSFVVEYRAHITATVKRVEGEHKHAADSGKETPYTRMEDFTHDN